MVGFPGMAASCFTYILVNSNLARANNTFDAGVARLHSGAIIRDRAACQEGGQRSQTRPSSGRRCRRDSITAFSIPCTGACVVIGVRSLAARVERYEY